MDISISPFRKGNVDFAKAERRLRATGDLLGELVHRIIGKSLTSLSPLKWARERKKVTRAQPARLRALQYVWVSYLGPGLTIGRLPANKASS